MKSLKTMIRYSRILIPWILMLYCPTLSAAIPADSSGKRSTIVKSEILDIKAKTIDSTVSTDEFYNVKARDVIKQLNKGVDINNVILILISNPKEFLSLRPSDNSKMILFAEGLPLDGITSRYFEMLSREDVETGKIKLPDSMWIPFILRRDESNKTAWNALYHLTPWYKNNISFKASLGWEGMFPLSVKARQPGEKPVNTQITVVFYSALKFWVFLVFYILFIGYFVYLCHTTGLIRDPDLHNKGPYSLSQTQLVFWTVLIVGGFIYSYVLTDLTDSLNTSILLLLGISIGTSGTASFIDYYKKKDPDPRRIKKHRSFMLDILSDGQNVSVQRAQTALWNLVFGVYFVWFLIDNKTMPVFSETLLLLSGVSSSFYLGSKVVENSNKPPDEPEAEEKKPVEAPAG